MIPTVALVMLIIVVVICTLTLAIAIWHTITTRLQRTDSEEASTSFENDTVPLTKPEALDVSTLPVRSITPEPESPPPLAGEESVYVLPPPGDISEPVNSSPSTHAPPPNQLNSNRPSNDVKPSRPSLEKVPFVLMDPPRGHGMPHPAPATPVSLPQERMSRGPRPLKPSPFQAQPHRDRTRAMTGPPRPVGNRHSSGAPQNRNPCPSRSRGRSPRLAGPFHHQKPRDRDDMNDIIDLYTSESRSIAQVPQSAPPRTTTFAEAKSKWAYFGRVEETSMV
ncbi:hypothetical protein B0A52_05034 [Exophiala mesophila]|uniref:Uncharacterized protein n=1 Tax=Exophiala mesophila TaxID=212818 RepID=A0A438N6U2_EXOME|nr:hypothetical protein B0A52_05034 [Exophiala mesophila]